MVRSRDILSDVALSAATLDRSGHERTEERLVERLLADPLTLVLELRGDRAFVESMGPAGGGSGGRHLRLRLRSPQQEDFEGVVIFAGRDRAGRAHVGVAHPPEGPELAPPGSAGSDEGGWLTLRQAGAGLDDDDASLFTTVLALANWHGTHTHCSRCGAATAPAQGGWLRVCPNDGSEHYPRTDAAVIMAVVDDSDRLLLGRGPQWPEGRFSVLAGFVEPGESFEAAVAREVAEEVGLEVTDVRYLGNQPWPFPSSVMIGFTARALSTDLDIDPNEVSEALWVTRDEYRAALRSGTIRAPFGISIAKRIIEHWLGETIEETIEEAIDVRR